MESVKETIKEFDHYLASRSLTFVATIIGGGALVIADIINRRTKDIDCLDPQIPKDIKEASEQFHQESPKLGLITNWLNNGPDSLKKNLPKGWQKRTEVIFKGGAITLYTLCRSDLLKTKLFAFCDRGQDLQDCIALKPSHQELDKAYEWVAYQDANKLWPKHVMDQFMILKEALND